MATAPAAARPAGELVLDAAAPVVAVRLGGVAMRLRVDLRQWDTVALNPAAAARLAVHWQAGRQLIVGRERLIGRMATARLEIGAARGVVAVDSYDRDVASEADGARGPDLLPYAAVRFLRAGAPPATGTRMLPIDRDSRTGWSAAIPELAGGTRLLASLALPDSNATAAAASMLARDYGGVLDETALTIPVAYGLTRPGRTMRFATAPVLAGFRFDALAVRIGDYRGDNPLPDDAAAPAGIVVARREVPQAAEPWVMLGTDRLRACAEIVFSRAAETLTLRCRFDGA